MTAYFHRAGTGSRMVPSGVIELLAAARAAGVTLTPVGQQVDIDGPAGTGHLITALRRRPDVVAHVIHVYTGTTAVLDWSSTHRAAVVNPPRPCRLCGRPTMLLDPFDRLPCHKTCAEAAIQGTAPHRSAGRLAA